MRENRVLLDPKHPDDALVKLAYSYDLDADTLEFLRRLLRLFRRRVLLYVDESSTLFYGQMPLVDRFTFNMQADELILFASDPLTFVDALAEMAMFLAGFTTMIGVDESWKVEFAIGAWKPVKSRLKRELGIPVIDEPLWVVGLPSDKAAAPTEDANPFRTLVSQLDIASFTQMVRLAARDDVEVNFPAGTDPRVIEVYIRMKTALGQVADGIRLDDWREFNRRLLATVQNLEEAYQPAHLPLPAWWAAEDRDPSGAADELDDLQFRVLDSDPQPDEDHAGNAPDRAASEDGGGAWDPFKTYLDGLFEADTDSDNDDGEGSPDALG